MRVIFDTLLFIRLVLWPFVIHTFGVFGMLVLAFTSATDKGFTLTYHEGLFLLKLSGGLVLFMHLIMSIVSTWSDHTEYQSCGCDNCKQEYRGPLFSFLKHFFITGR
jgi:hypothetical protein